MTLPLLFRPPDFDKPTVSVFSGLPDHRLSRDTNTSPRCPGVFGLYDFNDMSFYPLKPVVKSIF